MFAFWDGGYCHFTRIMTLAEEAQNRGITVGFITAVSRAEDLRSLATKSNIYVIPNRPPVLRTPPYPLPFYSHAYRHAQRMRGLGFHATTWLRQTTLAEIRAIQDFKPDAIINDYRDTIRSAALACDVPVAGVTQTTGNIDGYTLGWWDPPPGDANLPDCRDSFNEVRADLGLDPITDEREMFSGDVTIMPSIPRIDPLMVESPSTYYVGTLSRWNLDNGDFRVIPRGKAKKRVFSYVGDSSRPAYGFEKMLSDVIARERTTGFYVVGDKRAYSNSVRQRVVDGSVVIDNFIPGHAAIQDSDITLCHGGSGTVMLSLSLGKPLVCIGPYQSCCSSTFQCVERAGAGLMLNHSTQPLQRRKAVDLGEDIDIFGYWDSELTSEKVENAIREVTSNASYAESAQELGKELVLLGGAPRAIDIIEQELVG
jgi:hypothetical protein